MTSRSFFGKLVMLLTFTLITAASFAFAGRNICKCGRIGKPESTICEACNTPLNHCLKCGHNNMVKDDYCSKCSMPLAEMRVLASIDANVRSELKLGESPRALAEMEIKRLEYLLQTDSGNAEKYMFELAMVHKGINFYSRESAIWLDFLKKFPNSEKAQEASLYGSESLCKWSYLFYSQGLYDSALELINESLRLNPGNKEAGRWLKITRAAMKKTAHVPAKAVRETEPEKKAEPAAGSSEAAVQQQ